MSDAIGWMALLAGYGEPGAVAFPIPAYSEFMPPPRLGRKPDGSPTSTVRPGRPVGVACIRGGAGVGARAWPRAHRPRVVRLVARPRQRARGSTSCAATAAATSRAIRTGRRSSRQRRPARARTLRALLPLALSRTQDDKGRVRWTLFGVSEQGPARAFWRSFYTATRVRGRPPRRCAFLRRLLAQAYGGEAQDAESSARMRLCACCRWRPPDPVRSGAEPLPGWAAALLSTDERLRRRALSC